MQTFLIMNIFQSFTHRIQVYFKIFLGLLKGFSGKNIIVIDGQPKWSQKNQKELLLVQGNMGLIWIINRLSFLQKKIKGLTLVECLSKQLFSSFTQEAEEKYIYTSVFFYLNIQNVFIIYLSSINLNYYNNLLNSSYQLLLFTKSNNILLTTNNSNTLMLNLSSQSLTLSFKHSINLIEWIHENFQGINCLKIKQFNQLKSGVIIAQILTEILPENYQQVLLSKIQINNLNTDTCINNFKVVKVVLQNYVSMENISDSMVIHQYTAEALYYRQHDLQKFMNNVIVKLWEIKKQRSEKNKQFAKEKIKMFNSISKQIPKYQNTFAAHLLSYDEQQNYQSNEVKYERNKNVPQSCKKQYKYNSSNINVSQLSDIANRSSIEIINVQNNQENNTNQKIITNTKNTKANTQYNSSGQQLTQQQQQQQQINSQELPLKQIPQISQQQIQLLQQWVTCKLGTCPISQPHQLFGLLVNSLFCTSRLNNHVIKQAHFSHGPIFVYRKALQFLVENASAEKVEKNNVLSMMKSIEEDGVIRQGQYWKLVKDLYLYDMSKGRSKGSLSKHSSSKNRSSKKFSHKFSIDKQPQKQNRCFNPKATTRTLSKCKTSKQSITTNMNFNLINTKLVDLPRLVYNMSDVKEAQEWVSKMLGYEHTLMKSKNSSVFIVSNPLLNGTLVGSIMMRLKIGKPVINKIPNTMLHVRKNWDEINKIGSLRGYESLKKLMSHLNNLQKYNQNQLVNFYLAVLKQFKEEHNKKNPEIKNKGKDCFNTVQDSSNCNQCIWIVKTKENLNLSNLKIQKKQIKQWLLKNISIQIPNDTLSTAQLTQICRNLLTINIYKQTTQKIQINNVQKILGELRRIGLGDYYQITKEAVMGPNDDIRWKIVWDLKWVIDGKVQFCHV